MFDVLCGFIKPSKGAVRDNSGRGSSRGSAQCCGTPVDSFSTYEEGMDTILHLTALLFYDFLSISELSLLIFGSKQHRQWPQSADDVRSRKLEIRDISCLSP